MILAAVGDTGYKIVLLLHILTAMVAFAPAFVHPVLGAQSKSLDAQNQGRMLGFIAGNGRRIYGPALIVTGLLGFALAGMSDDVFSLSQGWLLAAAIIWVAMNGLLHAVLLPSEKRWSEGDESAEKMVGIAGATITVLLIVMLWLMIWKPGL